MGAINVADILTMQDLANGHLDVKALGEAANGDENTIVTTRTGNTYPSAERAIHIMFKNGGFPATPFATKAKMLTDVTLGDGDYAIVTDDPSQENGYYLKKEGSWTKTTFNPVGDLEKQLINLNYKKAASYTESGLTLKGVTVTGSLRETSNSGEFTVKGGDYLKMTFGATVGQIAYVWTDARGLPIPYDDVSGYKDYSTRLKNPIKGYTEVSLLVPDGVYGIKAMSYSETSPDYIPDSFSLVVYEKRNKENNPSIYLDRDGFVDRAAQISAMGKNTYHQLILPFRYGYQAKTKGLNVVGSPTTTLLDADYRPIWQHSMDGVVFDAVKGTEYLRFETIAPNHPSWSEGEDNSLSVEITVTETAGNIVFTETDFDKVEVYDERYGSTGYFPVYNYSYIYLRLGMYGDNYITYAQDVEGVSIPSLNIKNGHKITSSLFLTLPDEAALFRAHTIGESHEQYDDSTKALVIASKTLKGVFENLRKYDEKVSYEFDKVGNPVSGNLTYNSTDWIYVAKGTAIQYSTKAINGSASFEKMEDDGVPYAETLTALSGVFTAPYDGRVKFTSFNETHASYDASFEPSVKVVLGSEVATATSADYGTYPSSLHLKATRDISFDDGTDLLTTSYLWYDYSNNFYISNSLEGEKRFAFSYNSADFYGEPPEHFSMGFDYYGNILCVFKIEQLPYSGYSDSNRKNPIMLVSDEGYKPKVIDFGDRKKPSGWLQNNGFLSTKDGIHISEYTRPSVETANAWTASYPLTNASNWTEVLSFPLTTNVAENTTLKHIHNVDRDPYTGYLYVTTGDFDAGAWMFVSKDGGYTYTKILDGSEKYCRVLNFVFTEELIYWATDSIGDKHWLFQAQRDSEGVLDVANIVDLYKFPTDSWATYATIYLKSIEALVFLGRVDVSGDHTLPIDVWDIKAGTMHRLDVLDHNGKSNQYGFRCECFEFYPRGNQLICGFSRGISNNLYANHIKLLGNTQQAGQKVNNLVLNVNRVGADFSVTYDTIVS